MIDKSKSKKQLIDELANAKKQIAKLKLSSYLQDKSEEQLSQLQSSLDYAENELKDIKIRYKSFVQSFNGIAFQRKIDNSLSFLHGAVKEILGYTENEIISKELHWDIMVYENDLPTFQNEMLRLNSIAGYSTILEYRIVDKGKNIKWVREHAHNICDNNNTPKYIQGVIYETTERKMVEEAVMISEEKYKSMFDTAANMIILVNNKGIIIDCNKQVTEITRYFRHELIGFNLTKIIHPSYKNKISDLFTYLPQTMSIKNLEYKILCKENSLIDVAMNSAAVNIENDDFEWAILVIEDISERKRITEEITKSREKLRKLAEHLETVREDEKKRIAYIIHDDIGQSLTALKLNIRLMINDIEKINPEINQNRIEIDSIIDKCIYRIRNLSSELRPAILDHLGLVYAIDWILEEFSKKTKILCHFEHEPDDIQLDAYISTVLFRILQEVMANILRHSGASDVDITLVKTKNQIEFTAHDNGVGIKEQEIKNPTSFGIVAIKERVHNLHGAINIIGDEVNGTSIKITIPLT